MINTLKIFSKLEDIVKSVKENNVTIISTPTGSGKTLAVPFTLQYCLGKKVFVTVPRVLLAKSARNSVIKLIVGEKFSHKVGVMTGKYNENIEANLVFSTERSFLNRVTLDTDNILVIDEIHEQGINTEEVIYVAKQHALKGGKVLLMSATMDISKYVKYFGDAQVIELPESERQFSTEIIESDRFNYINKVIELGGITLIGEAGKKDIERVIKELRNLGYKNPILPLHSEIEEYEEDEILYLTKNKKDYIIVATSVAMSGITFENLDNVVPPIEGNRIEDGKLVSYILSKAEVKQWEGRVGRMNKGTIIRRDKNIEREINPLPEILRIDTIDTVVSFLNKGVDLRKIELLNHPSEISLNKSFKILEQSNIIKENKLTEKGEFIANLGEGILTGSLLYEGKKLGIENFAMKIAAVINYGNPFKKMKYKVNVEDQFKNSEHYIVVNTIETDIMLDHKFNLNIREFCQNNGIFLKGVNKLKKQFKKINNEYSDNVKLTNEILCELLKNQLVTNIYNFGTNDYNKVVSNMYSESMFVNLTPVILKGGMLAELTTILK